MGEAGHELAVGFVCCPEPGELFLVTGNNFIHFVGKVCGQLIVHGKNSAISVSGFNVIQSICHVLKLPLNAKEFSHTNHTEQKSKEEEYA